MEERDLFMTDEDIHCLDEPTPEEIEIEKEKWIEKKPLDLLKDHKITIDVIELYRLTGMSRSSFYRTFKKLVKKGYIREDQYNIVDQSGSKENKEKYNLV